jgi:hypothetical protein
MYFDDCFAVLFSYINYGTMKNVTAIQNGSIGRNPKQHKQKSFIKHKAMKTCRGEEV